MATQNMRDDILIDRGTLKQIKSIAESSWGSYHISNVL